MTEEKDSKRDARYVNLLLEPLQICKSYKPSFGKSTKQGLTLNDFKQIYSEDPLYHWIGMDSSSMYAAHKAAGGMTSIYRQLGSGCERLVRQIIKDELALSDTQINWNYNVKRGDGSTRTLTLDARIDNRFIKNRSIRQRVENWTSEVAKKMGFNPEQIGLLSGSVFEIRQGYKSQDAKRQNADMQSAIRARNDNYVFVMAVMSSQISKTLRRRYQNSQMLVLLGNRSQDPLENTFSFLEQVIGYPITHFFERNSKSIQKEFERIIKALLSPT